MSTELIVDFLEARCRDDEQAAWRQQADYAVFDAQRTPDAGHVDAVYIDPLSYPGMPADPSRVLREVAAKRKILALHHGDFPYNPEDGPGDYSWTEQCQCCYQPMPCPTLRALASVWAGHDSFRAEWSVTE